MATTTTTAYAAASTTEWIMTSGLLQFKITSNIMKPYICSDYGAVFQPGNKSCVDSNLFLCSALSCTYCKCGTNF